MYSVVSSVGLSMLLLSSFITLVVLLGKQYKQWINTPFYVLSTSDLLHSILTASILLLNHIGTISNTDYNAQSNSTFSNDISWNKVNEYKINHQDKFEQFGDSYNATIQMNFNITSQCYITNVIMQYAMLYIPLTNSFVSLLVFSTQCNLSVFYLKRECNKLLQCQPYMQSSDTSGKSQSYNAMEFNTTHVIEFGSEPNSAQHVDPSIMEETKSGETNCLQVAKLNEFKENDKKVISIFVLCQWLIPLLVAGMLYFAEYSNTNYIHNIETTECSILNNFTFDNCYNWNTDINAAQNLNSVMYTSSDNGYIDNGYALNLPNFNDTEVNDIVSKVQSIIYFVLNDPNNASNNAEHASTYDSSELSKVAESNKIDADINSLKYENSIVKLESNPKRETSITDNISTRDLSEYVQNNSESLQNNTDEHNNELLLFNNLLRTSQEENSVKWNDTSEQITMNISESLNFNYEKETRTNISSKVQNTMEQSLNSTIDYRRVPMSNDEIYTEILKRIHGFTAPNVLRNNHRNNRYYNNNKDQQKQNEFKTEIFPDNSEFLKNVSSTAKTRLQGNTTCAANQCSISIKFVKLHLLVLLFLIYFLSILLSSILHVRCQLTCKVISGKLKFQTNIKPNNSDADDTKNRNNTDFDKTDSRSICSSSNWFPKYNEDRFKKLSLQEKQGDEEQSSKEWNGQRKTDDASYIVKQNNTDKEKQIKDMRDLLCTFKISLLCGTFLWTPAFLEVLLRVFLCLYAPEWLSNLTYLCAMGFGILRNVFNLRMIKLQGINASAIKINSVRPVV